MNHRKIHIILGFLLLMLMGTSLTFSTLHSHHHLQWHHSEDYTETGNCITKDTTLCPICGYHIKTGLPEFNSGKTELYVQSRVVAFCPSISLERPHLPVEGRSPPSIA